MCQSLFYCQMIRRNELLSKTFVLLCLITLKIRQKRGGKEEGDRIPKSNFLVPVLSFTLHQRQSRFPSGFGVSQEAQALQWWDRHQCFSHWPQCWQYQNPGPMNWLVLKLLLHVSASNASKEVREGKGGVGLPPLLLCRLLRKFITTYGGIHINRQSYFLTQYHPWYFTSRCLADIIST